MELILFGSICTGIGALLGVISIVVGNSYEYALRVEYGDMLNWATPVLFLSIILFVIGLILLIVGLAKHSSAPQAAKAAYASNAPTPLFCTQCASQLLQGNYVCGICHHDNSLDLFLCSALPECKAAEINNFWYKFGLDKRYPAATKELLSLVQQERRTGKSDRSQNERFLSEIRSHLKEN